MKRASEDGLIARYFGPLAGPGGLALLDDAALLSPEPGYDLVLTADALVAGVHFLPDDPPASVARKALGVNLSDLAAKGAHPVGYLLTLALPDDWTETWLAAFAEGLRGAGAAAGIALLGGDTVRAAGPLSLSITAVGQVPSGTMVLRTRARPGDLVCVSGTIGDAVLGLHLLTGHAPWAAGLSQQALDHMIDRYRHPRARLALAAALREHATAAMDVSDGLVGDLAKMLRVSGVTAELDLAAVPFGVAALAALARAPSLRDALVTGGDDYEILASVPPEQWPAFEAAAKEVGVPIAIIGRVRAGTDAPVWREGGEQRGFASSSYQHF